MIIDGRNINWSVSWGGLLDFSEVSYINLSGLEVINSTHAGIFLDDCHHITIKNAKTHNTYSSMDIEYEKVAARSHLNSIREAMGL